MNSTDCYELPASFLQAEYLSAVRDARSNDNVSVLLDLSGPLDPDALTAALGLLAARHDVLRTALARRGSTVIQRVGDTDPPPLERADLRGPDPTGPALVHLLSEQAQRPFLLTQPPLWRAALIYVSFQRHVLALTLHHSIADRWSGEVIRRDLAALYADAFRRRDSTLVPLPIQFADYADSEHTASYRTRESYWRYALNPLPPAPRLPDSGKWRTGDPLTIAVRQLPAISPQDTDALRAAGDTCRASLGDTIHAAAAAAMSPFFDEEMVLGVLHMNRNRGELIPLIGPLFDHLPIRVRIDKGTTFLHLLSAFQATWTMALASKIPLGRITPHLAHQLLPDRLIFDVEINYLPHITPELLRVPIDDDYLTFGYFRDAAPDSLDIQLDQEVSPNGRLGFQVEGTESGGLQGAVFANADALGWSNLAPMGAQLAAAFALLARYPNSPIRELIEFFPTDDNEEHSRP